MAESVKECWIVFFGSSVLHPQIDGIFLVEADATNWCERQKVRTGIPFWHEKSYFLDGIQDEWVDKNHYYYVPGFNVPAMEALIEEEDE